MLVKRLNGLKFSRTSSAIKMWKSDCVKFHITALSLGAPTYNHYQLILKK